MLFTEDLIPPDTYFYLRLHVAGKTKEELAERVNCLKRLLRPKRTFRLGGAKSRSHGKVEATRIEDRPPFAEALRERIESLDRYLKSKLRGGVADNAAANDRTFFTITLQSPVILPDQETHPDWKISEGKDGDWQRIFPLVAALPDARLEFFQHRFTRITGWSSVWGLPKPALRALSAGSVYLFSTAATAGDLETLLPVAEEMEFSGAGPFRAEGFGALKISDPFHREASKKDDDTV